MLAVCKYSATESILVFHFASRPPADRILSRFPTSIFGNSVLQRSSYSRQKLPLVFECGSS